MCIVYHKPNGARGEKFMWEYIVKRVVTEGEYIVSSGATVRSAAAYFNVSKSTVHTEVS